MQEMSDSTNCKEEGTAVFVENDGVMPMTGSIDSSSGSSQIEINNQSADSVVLHEDFVVVKVKEVQNSVEALECDGATTQNFVANGLSNTGKQCSSTASGIECVDTSDVGVGGKENPEMCENECEDVNAAPWERGPSGFVDAAVFTRRRDSSSDSIDSESSSSSSSEWDSSSDTALVSDEDSVKQVLPGSCGKPKRVVVPPVKTKGEFTLDDLPPIEDLHISLPEHECKELGKVVSIVDKLVVVEPHKDLPTLNLDSVLFLDGGKRAMGHVFDVFGQVKEPLYCVRFNSIDHIRDSGVSVGTKVYCAPDTPYSNYVFVNQLLSIRGSDASWEQDNEPPSSVIFYSDDEEEREARRRVKHEKSKLRTGGVHGLPATQEPQSKRLNLMEERNNRRNLLLNATFSSTSQHGKRQARGRGWVAPSPDDFIIKPSSFNFSTNWKPPPQDGQSESKPRLQPSSTLSASNSPLFGICRPPQFPFSSARFSVPPPLVAGKSLLNVLRSQTPEMLTFVQPPPSNQPPVRTFVGSGSLPFATTQHPPVSLGSPRPPETTAVRPRPFASPVAHISFRPMQCPPSVLTSPPPPFGVSFNMLQRPPDLSAGRLSATTVCGPFRPQSSVSGTAGQKREFSDAASKPMVFNPSQPPPSLSFKGPATCGTLSSSSHSQAFSPTSRVLLSTAPTLSTASVRGASCQQPSSASLGFDPTQRPPSLQQPSPPVFGAPWLRDPWNGSALSPRATGVWQTPNTAPRLPGDMWQSRDIWQPQASGTPSCSSWQVSNSSWRMPSNSQQLAGPRSSPAWQNCDQPLGPGRPAVMQFDVLRLRSPPPPPPSSDSSFYR